MTCVECRKNRADQMIDLLSENKANCREAYQDGRAAGRLNTLEEIQSKIISLHTDMIFKYGVDIIEARADAFDELKDWLKEQIEMYGE